MNKTLLISIDALRSEDITYMTTLPTFSKIINEGFIGKKVTSIFPSVTYPCHASLITGCYPEVHGIYNNYLFDPGNLKPNWFWEYSRIKCPTLIDCALKNNLKVTSIFWPVTADLKIPYNIPEVLPHGIYKTQPLASFRFSSKYFLLKCILKHGKLLNGIAQPNLDNFALNSLLESLGKSQFSLIHFTDLDSMRHEHGTNSKEAKQALERMDKRLSIIFDHLKALNQFDDTTFFLFGDHSFKDVKFKSHINSFLRDKGFISLDNRNKLVDYSAYAHKCDGACEIFTKDENSKEKLINLLDNDTCQLLGIKKVHFGDSLKKLNLGNDISIVLEAQQDYMFDAQFDSDIFVEKLKPTEAKGQHGYNPRDPNYQTMFLAYGKGIKEGSCVESMNLVDIAPTISEFLAFELNHAQGISVCKKMKRSFS